MKKLTPLTPLTLLLCLGLFACGSGEKKDSATDFNQQVEDYISKFAYQDTYNYMVRYTGGEASNLNSWALGKEPSLVVAGEDKVVRMNNDTYYKIAFVDLSKGPVILKSSAQTNDRFSSFQLMDDHNTNYHNVINPDGEYVLYQGEAPQLEGAELIEVPSTLSVIVTRIEVKEKNDPNDTEKAKSIFNGITIEGPEITEFPQLDLFSEFSEEVIARGNEMLDSTFKVVEFRLTVSSPDQLGKEVPVINHAAGTKGGWGGPITTHSSYEAIFNDANGETLDGSKGNYSVTFEEPPVDAFWSLTVYDTKRGGYFHPNKDDRYHINGSTAVPNADGTFTIIFKTNCDTVDKNCLEVPAGPFDIAPRYYLPKESIWSGTWKLPGVELIK
jgi:hypothetical protein